MHLVAAGGLATVLAELHQLAYSQVHSPTSTMANGRTLRRSGYKHYNLGNFEHFLSHELFCNMLRKKLFLPEG